MSAAAQAIFQAEYVLSRYGKGKARADSEVSEVVRRVVGRLPSLGEKSLWVRREGEEVHASGERWLGCGKVGKGERMTWKDLGGAVLCPRCLRTPEALGGLGKTGMIMNFWTKLEEAVKRLEGEGSVLGLPGRVSDAERLGGALARETRSLPVEERREVRQFLVEVSAQVEEAREILHGERGRRMLEDEVFVHLGVRRGEADETPTLLGVTRAHGRGELATVELLFGVREGLLVLPRFVAEWVVASLESGKFTPMVSVAEKEVLEVAAGLWERGSESAMGSLHAAVVAARKVMA